MKYSRTRSRKYYGGSPSGAWPWAANAYGATPEIQVMNTFGSPNNTGNMAVPIPGSHALNPYPGFSANPATVGGRRKRRHKKKGTMKGGFWGLGDAIVPATLLTMQQYFGPKRRKGSTKRRR
jgi:hypothetical protein